MKKTISYMSGLYVDDEHKNWDAILPYATFAYNHKRAQRERENKNKRKAGRLTRAEPGRLPCTGEEGRGKERVPHPGRGGVKV